MAHEIFMLWRQWVVSSQHSDGTLVAMPAICNGGVAGDWKMSNMNSMKLVIPLHSLYWSIHTKDESKRRIVFAHIFGVNQLWRCGIAASFGVFFFMK